jgi:DNA-binding transcriptional ArsR family regulator
MPADPSPSDPRPAPQPEPAAPVPLRPRFTPDQLLPVLGDPARYRMLGLLLDGAPHSPTELGRLVGKSRMSASKHLAWLRIAGLIEPCANRSDRRTTCFRLIPEFTPAPGAPRTLDFGWCLLRYDPAPAENA